MIPRDAVDLTVPCKPFPSTDRHYPRTTERIGPRRYRQVYRHRLAYEASKGPLRDGETVDHVCFNRRCLEPLHLEAVTAGENTHRAWVAGRQTRIYATQSGVSPCKRGHEPNWLRQGRGWACRVCHRISANRSYHRKVGTPSIYP